MQLVINSTNNYKFIPVDPGAPQHIFFCSNEENEQTDVDAQLLCRPKLQEVTAPDDTVSATVPATQPD